GGRGDVVSNAVGGDEAALAVRHRPGEGTGHDPGHGGQLVLGDPDRVNCDAGVRGPDEQGAQVLDVLVDAVGEVPVGPVDADVLRMAFAKAGPVGVGEDVEVQLV